MSTWRMVRPSIQLACALGTRPVRAPSPAWPGRSSISVHVGTSAPMARVSRSIGAVARYRRPGAPDSGPRSCRINRVMVAHRADQVRCRQAVGLDHVAVSQGPPLDEPQPPVARILEAQLLGGALDRFAEEPVRVRVDGCRRAGIAAHGHQGPAARALPERRPAAAYAVGQRAGADRNELANRWAEQANGTPQRRVVECAFVVEPVEQAGRLRHGEQLAAREALVQQPVLGARAGLGAVGKRADREARRAERRSAHRRAARGEGHHGQREGRHTRRRRPAHRERSPPRGEQASRLQV